MSHLPRCLVPLLLVPLLLAACATDQSPTAPAARPPDLAAAAFRITIDVASGRATIVRPARAARTDGGLRPSLSLIGAEAVELELGDCSWGPAPNAKFRRCLLDLAITNRLGSTDLVTPTTFPQPPAGTNGVLVFPFTSAALTASGGGAAVPTSDWDEAPINFFNDVGCGRGASDCYRYELYEGPLYAGETSVTRTVGFDVDRSAHTVQAYVLVAADLRDNPRQELTLGATECGYVGTFPNGEPGIGGSGGVDLLVGTIFNPTDRFVHRSFCGFRLPNAVVGKSVARAVLRMHQDEVRGAPYGGGNALVVDHFDFGNELDFGDFDGSALQANIGVLSADESLGWKSLDVTGAVGDDVASARVASQFRLRFSPIENPDGLGRFEEFGAKLARLGGPNAPQLVITYRNR